VSEVADRVGLELFQEIQIFLINNHLTGARVNFLVLLTVVIAALMNFQALTTTTNNNKSKAQGRHTCGNQIREVKNLLELQ